MKKYYFFSVSVFMVAILLLPSCQKENDVVFENKITTRGSGPSANGQGALIADYLGDAPQHFSFHASTDRNGNVTGSYESTALGLDSRVHGTIDCLYIFPDGKTAILSGIATVVTGEVYLEDFGFVVGSPIWFKVVDNGEGAKAAEDTFSDIYVDFLVPLCTSDLDVEMLTIVNGNIQVKP